MFIKKREKICICLSVCIGLYDVKMLRFAWLLFLYCLFIWVKPVKERTNFPNYRVAGYQKMWRKKNFADRAKERDECKSKLY